MIAEVMDVPFEQVKVEVGTTDAFRSESGTGASRVTFVLGQAVLNAAEKLKTLLQKSGAEIFGVSAGEVAIKKGRLVAGLGGSPAVSLAQAAATAASKGEALEVESYFEATETPAEGVFAACVAEVQVDGETGQLYLRKLDTVHDVATILNPVSHQGQIDGGIIQGVGYALMEEMVMTAGRGMPANRVWSPGRLISTEKLQILRWRRRLPMKLKMRWACGSWICRSPRRKFFAHYSSGGPAKKTGSYEPVVCGVSVNESWH
jgi:CO/xanthine dehydrogenase Mo-binding subunit